MPSKTFDDAFRAVLLYNKSNSLDGKLASSSQAVSILNEYIQFIPSKKSYDTESAHLKEKYIHIKSSPQSSNGNGVLQASLLSSGTTAWKLLNNNNGVRQCPAAAASTSICNDIPPPAFDIFPVDGIRLQWDSNLRRSTSTGLNNLGNTCFLNSVLQVLTNTAPLANFLLGNEHDTRKCPEMTGFCALCAMKLHITRVYSCAMSNGVTSPHNIVKNLRCVMKAHAPGRQEDAHEYLRYFVDSMQMASLYSYKDKKLDLYTKETSAISRIFGGYHKNEIICNNCQFNSTTFDPFLDLSVEVKQLHSLEAALAHFTRTEILTSENAYKCPKCNRRVSAKKIFTIQQPPNVLTIQLKRFDHFGKIDRLITFPERLNLRPYMTEKQGPHVLYKLYGVVVHVGRTTHSGHYYAFVRNPCDQWHLVDDERVTPVSVATALKNPGAYVLFYNRIPTQVASIKPQPKPQNMFIGPQQIPSGTSSAASTQAQNAPAAFGISLARFQKFPVITTASEMLRQQGTIPILATPKDKIEGRFNGLAFPSHLVKPLQQPEVTSTSVPLAQAPMKKFVPTILQKRFNVKHPVVSSPAVPKCAATTEHTYAESKVSSCSPKKDVEKLPDSTTNDDARKDGVVSPKIPRLEMKNDQQDMKKSGKKELSTIEEEKTVSSTGTSSKNEDCDYDKDGHKKSGETSPSKNLPQNAVQKEQENVFENKKLEARPPSPPDIKEKAISPRKHAQVNGRDRSCTSGKRSTSPVPSTEKDKAEIHEKDSPRRKRKRSATPPKVSFTRYVENSKGEKEKKKKKKRKHKKKAAEKRRKSASPSPSASSRSTTSEEWVEKTNVSHSKKHDSDVVKFLQRDNSNMYGSGVKSWNGHSKFDNRSYSRDHDHSDHKMYTKRRRDDDDYNEEYDRGKSKRMKKYHGEYTRMGANQFQKAQNHRNYQREHKRHWRHGYD